MIHLVNRLFDARGRRTLILSSLAMLVASFGDMFAILLVAPLGVAMTGGDVTQGAWRPIWTLLGSPSSNTFTILVLLLILITFIVKDVATLAIQWWQSGFVTRESCSTRERLIAYYMSMPWSEYVQRGQADFLNRLNNVSLVYSGVTAMTTLFSQAISVFAILAALLAVSPLVTLTLLAFFSIVAFSYTRLSNGLLREYNVQRIRQELEQSAITLRIFGGAKELRVRNAQPHFASMYSRATRAAAHVVRRASFIQGLPKYVLEIVSLIALGAVVGVTSWAGQVDQLVPTLALVAVAAFRVLPALSGAVGSSNIIASSTPSIELVLKETESLRRFEERAAGEPSNAPSRVLSFEHELRLDDVHYRYGENFPEVIRGVSLVIPAGASVALVGGSGAGKSTLIDIILGLLEPTAGSVNADGRDIFRDLAAWQLNVAMVPQSVYLMDASVGDNVIFDGSLNEEDAPRVWDALDGAELRGTVERLEEGLNTRLGDYGARLSGGQRQRVGIARALYRNPRVLVLDEATSALDNETEKRIAETIEALRGRITLIMVAHRLSTVRDADVIVYLEDGMVSAIGRFDELRANSEGFRRLAELGDLK